MSLINEALKKAQRARQEGASTPDANEPGGPVARRPKSRSARSMLLMGVGAVVLVVGSMVGTAVWLTRAPEPASAPAKAAPVAAVPPTAELPAITAPVSVAPAPASDVTPIAVTLPPAPASPPPAEKRDEARVEAAATPTPTTSSPAAPVADVPVAAQANLTDAASTAAPAPAEPVPDERVHKFVESVRVMGIRSSGSESKVLMNDRVYRVNDVVERSLGVKLTKVAPDSLTFTDANGAVYVKNF